MLNIKKHMEFLIIKIKMYLCKNNLCVTVTPVYSRVSPMTICMLMKNTLLAAKHEIY